MPLYIRNSQTTKVKFKAATHLKYTEMSVNSKSGKLWYDPEHDMNTTIWIYNIKDTLLLLIYKFRIIPIKILGF